MQDSMFWIFGRLKIKTVFIKPPPLPKRRKEFPSFSLQSFGFHLLLLATFLENEYNKETAERPMGWKRRALLGGGRVCRDPGNCKKGKVLF